MKICPNCDEELDVTMIAAGVCDHCGEVFEERDSDEEDEDAADPKEDEAEEDADEEDDDEEDDEEEPDDDEKGLSKKKKGPR